METAQAVAVMYTTRWCPYCVSARRLLEQEGIRYRDIAVDGDQQLRAQMTASSGQHTVPQIWIGETHVGGYTDLWALYQRGELSRLLAEANANTSTPR